METIFGNEDDTAGGEDWSAPESPVTDGGGDGEECSRIITCTAIRNLAMVIITCTTIVITCTATRNLALVVTCTYCTAIVITPILLPLVITCTPYRNLRAREGAACLLHVPRIDVEHVADCYHPARPP